MSFIPSLNLENPPKPMMPNAAACLSLAAALERRSVNTLPRVNPHAVFASSLAVEDMVITDAVCRVRNRPSGYYYALIRATNP